jgi:hypothetical protein
MDTERKLNCWEFRACGREPGGKNIDTCGACPTPLEDRLDGVHGGKNGGRACWVVPGTLTEGRPEDALTTKIAQCGLCEFYEKVREEEGEDSLIPTYMLMHRISNRLR